MASPSTTSEHRPRIQATEIAGTLRDPLVRPLSTGDGEQITYHWATEDNRHTFLYASFRRDPSHAVELASTNVDSEDVRGQGDAIWSFLGRTLQDRSNKTGVRIIHEVHPNGYSRRLPEADPRYLTLDQGQTFLGLYEPQPNEQTHGAQVSHALGAVSVPPPEQHA